jgi:acetyl-CoA carboxylase / biotin carboxylase 1
MYNNGVSHITAKDDLHGVSEIMNWLSFVPEKRNAPVPIHPSVDDWDRDIEYTPTKGVYDVRWSLEGKEEDDTFLRGFFDRGSFRETLSGWAKTVVCVFFYLWLTSGCRTSTTRWYSNGCHCRG